MILESFSIVLLILHWFSILTKMQLDNFSDVGYVFLYIFKFTNELEQCNWLLSSFTFVTQRRVSSHDY